MSGRIQAIANLLDAAVFVADANGRISYASTQWQRLTGLDPREVGRVDWQVTVHPDDREAVAERWAEAIAGRHICIMEFRSRRPGGKRRDLLWRAVPYLDEDRNKSGFIGLCCDVGADDRREAALRALARELDDRVKELDCLYGISHIVERSRGSLETILRDTAHLLPRSWTHPEVATARIRLEDEDYRSPDFAETPWRQVADLRVHEKTVGSVEVAYLEARPDRDEGPFLTRERALLHAVAERLGHIVERLGAHQRIEKRQEELRERLTHMARVGLMGEMASSIAHEVNQPLTAIATFAQASRRLAEAGTLDAERAVEALDRIARDALRAGTIIHRLRDLVRKQEVSQRECDLNALIRDVAHLAAVDARLHDVRLRLDLNEPLRPIRADGVQLQQIILNLVRNAVDAMTGTPPPDREIAIRTATAADGAIVVSVEDHGCGISEDTENQLFQPFFSTKEHGMGMGLSVSRTIAAAHGGRLWFERNAGRGVTFHLAVPPVAEDCHAVT